MKNRAELPRRTCLSTLELTAEKPARSGIGRQSPLGKRGSQYSVQDR